MTASLLGITLTDLSGLNTTLKDLSVLLWTAGTKNSTTLRMIILIQDSLPNQNIYHIYPSPEVTKIGTFMHYETVRYESDYKFNDINCSKDFVHYFNV